MALNRVDFGTVTGISKASNYVTNPNSRNTSSTLDMFSQATKQDKRQYQATETESVAYANPFSFLNNGSSDSTTTLAAMNA